MEDRALRAHFKFDESDLAAWGRGETGGAALKTVTGPIELTSVERRSNDRDHTVRVQPVLRLGHVGFEVSREVFDWLRAGDSYAVYYVGGAIQSLEPSAAASPQASPAENDNDARILALIRRHDKLDAIRLHRELSNSSLAEARGAVEALAAGQ